MSFVYQNLHSEIAEVRQELKQDISNVTPGLQELSHTPPILISRTTLYASAASTLKLSTASEGAKQNHEKTNTEVPVGKGPSAPPFVISNIGPAQSTTEVHSEPSLTKQGQLESQSKDGQGPLVPPITSNKNKMSCMVTLDRGLWPHRELITQS
ncbi:unnamed protein product [Mytilus coruscus]|uniref:Uncharacterized protein n=1 Tax=Mytilus coruscus TaxID=42192 RepID=A0A6J8EKW9_MYTCO|nr:unnamed protein product [Mytilus coruscus]